MALVVLGAAGIWLAAPPDWRLHVLLLLPVVVTMGAHTIVFGHSRYHLPLMPILALYAAALITTFDRRAFRLLNPAAIGATASVGDPRADLGPSDRARGPRRGLPACSPGSADVVPSLAAPSAMRTIGLPNPVGSGTRIRAVLFDLDGTLYDQRRMRRRMAWELATDCCCSTRLPRSGACAGSGSSDGRRKRCGTTTRAAGRPRSRATGSGGHPRRVASRRTGLAGRRVDGGTTAEASSPAADSTACASCSTFSQAAESRVGVFSDYPPHAKLRALGVADAFSLVLCASDPDIGAFKPTRAGFWCACERWGLPPREVLMVGDRPDVDAAGAAAAGMPCVIIGQRALAVTQRRPAC